MMDIYIVTRIDRIEEDPPIFLGLFTDDYACDRFIENYCKYNNIDPREKDEVIEVIYLQSD